MKLFYLGIFSLLTCGAATAQSMETPTSDISSGSTSGALSISTTVKSLCNISNNSFANIDFGEYIGAQISRSVSFPINCKGTTNIKFGVDLGTNPFSTKELRRMPKDGKMGDVNYYVGYKITETASLNSSLIGGVESPFTTTLSGYMTNFSFSIHLLKDQKNIVLGDYYDDLDAFFEYN